ncbi:MAG: FGGY family carbohydrate kinase [Promethearchaeati archaeon SRVP18_Atabeyarchaeia-1]
MSDEYLIGIDFGTSGGKCLITDLKGNEKARTFKEWWYSSPEEIRPYAKEFNANDFWRFISEAVRETLRKAKVPAGKVVGVSSSSLRQGIVLLDADGEELYAGPNIDARGALAQDKILNTLGDQGIFDITGQGPTVICAPARLLWFKENKPEVYKKVSHMLMVNDWVLYRLSGVYASEHSCASSSAFLDVEKREWSAKVCQELELPSEILADLYRSGEKIGAVTMQASKETGLAEGTAVVTGGGDSMLGLLGTAAVDDYDTTVIGGTTSMLQTVLSTPLVDSERRIPTSCHVIPGKWVIEANAGMTGKVYNWLRLALSKALATGKTSDRSQELDFKQMDELAGQIPPGSDNMYAILGSEIMDLKKIETIRPGMFLFPPPANPMTVTPTDARHMIRATIENMACALHGNKLVIEEVIKRKIKKVKATGGLSKGRIWVQTLADVSGIPVETFRLKEGSLLGCAICAATGIGEYGSLEEAAKNMVQLEATLEPNKEVREVYEGYFDRWRELYDKIVGF